MSRLNIYVGVDPGFRATGLCATWSCGRKHGAYRWWEIKGQGGLDVCMANLPGMFTRWADSVFEWAVVNAKVGRDTKGTVYWCVERQYGGGLGSQYTLPAQSTILSSIVLWKRRYPNLASHVLFPWPKQCRTYLWERYGIVAKSKKPIVDAASEKLREKVSSHVADAYFLMKLGQAVVAKTFAVSYAKDSNLIIDGGPWGFDMTKGFYKGGRMRHARDGNT